MPGWSLQVRSTEVEYLLEDLDDGDLVDAILTCGDLRLLLSAPGGGPGGGQAMPDGTLPAPGKWNRFAIEVTDLAATVNRLRRAGVHLRSDPITGVGSRQVVIDDPSGNPIELFEPTRTEARLPNRSHSGRSRVGLSAAAGPADSLSEVLSARGRSSRLPGALRLLPVADVLAEAGGMGRRTSRAVLTPWLLG